MQRSEFLASRVQSLLGRLSPPKSISKAPHLQKEEISLITNALSSAMPKQGFEVWWGQFEERLLSSHETRAWPTIREIKIAAAFKDSSRGSMDEDANYFHASDFFDRHGKPCPWFNNVSFTNRILNSGRLESLAEARTRGFNLTTEQNEQAKAMRMSKHCWRVHIRVMAKLTRRPEQEVEAIEARAISDGHLPLHVLKKFTMG